MTDKPGSPAVRTMRARGLVNLAVRGLLHTPGLSWIMGSRLVTLYVAGRKSGHRYTVPVSDLAQGDDLLIGRERAGAACQGAGAVRPVPGPARPAVISRIRCFPRGPRRTRRISPVTGLRLVSAPGPRHRSRMEDVLGGGRPAG